MALTVKTRDLTPVPPDGEEVAARKQLADLGYAEVPLGAKGEALRTAVLAVVDAVIIKELTEDPEGLYAASRNKLALAKAMFEPYTKQVGVSTGLTDEDGKPLPDQPLLQTFPPRYNTLIAGIPFAPNIIDVDDLFATRK